MSRSRQPSPQPGDLWRDRHGQLQFVAGDEDGDLAVVDRNGEWIWLQWQDAHLVELVHRDG